MLCREAFVLKNSFVACCDLVVLFADWYCLWCQHVIKLCARHKSYLYT